MWSVRIESLLRALTVLNTKTDVEWTLTRTSQQFDRCGMPSEDVYATFKPYAVIL